MNFATRTALFAAFALTGLSARAQQATGTLSFDVKPFTSEVELKPKVLKQLESGGIEWGVKDGQIVITMVNKRFIDFEISHMTRYGQSEQVTLPAGNYRVTAIGLEMHTAFSAEKVLNKGAYVNEDVVSFVIEDGKKTTLSVLPIIKKDMTFFVKWYMPALMVSVVTDAGATPEKIINARTEGSIAWPKYSGPLKFVAK